MNKHKRIMKFKQMFLIVFAVIANTMFYACSSDEPVTPEVTVAESSMNYFTDAMEFTSSGGSKILNFTTNVDWTLTVSATQNGNSWCTVSQNKGEAGSFSLAVIVEENLGYEDRNTVLVLQAGNITKNVIINQKQKNSITVTTDRFEVDAAGGTINIEVKSNIDYTVEVPEQYQSWISKTSNSRALSTQSLSFDIAESKEYDKREGEIILTSNEFTEKVKVYQAGSAILVLSQNEYTLGSEGGTVSIDISSNFVFETDMPDVDWIKSANNNRAVSSHTLVYTIDENTTYDDREAVIVFKDTKSSKRESVKIKQRQKDAILLANSKVEIPQEGGVFSIDVNSNINYSIDIQDSCSDWISQVNGTEARSLTKSTLYFKASSSEELEKREGEIYFKYGNITEKLKIYQSGGTILVLNEDSYNLEGNTTTISVDLKSNIGYTVSTSVDWITEVTTRAVSNSTKNFKIATNKTGKSRTGKITFTTTDGKKSAQVTITQASIIEAKSLSINFSNTSGTVGGNLYIGKDYKFTVSVTPNNAATDYEWKVEDTSIASISGNGEQATLSTKNFGKTKVVVTEKNTGISESYEFGTCVTDFMFTETSRETQYGYPVVKIELGGQHQIKCSYTPSYATNIFHDLQAFKLKEISSNVWVMVDKSSIVDIDANGLMTAKKLGTTIIETSNNCGVYNNGSNNGIFVEVVEEITPYGTIGGHGYVDLGLPSGKLWATENFGSFSETGYGSYYMWSSEDRVPSSWGTKWSTPTRSEFNELLNNCSYSWTTKNGVNGYLFTGKNGATMFLPAAGFKIYVEGYGLSDIQSGSTTLMYWASTKSSYTWEGHAFAFTLYGTSSSLSADQTYNTSVCAATIRPISR